MKRRLAACSLVLLLGSAGGCADSRTGAEPPAPAGAAEDAPAAAPSSSPTPVDAPVPGAAKMPGESSSPPTPVESPGCSEGAGCDGSAPPSQADPLCQPLALSSLPAVNAPIGGVIVLFDRAETIERRDGAAPRWAVVRDAAALVVAPIVNILGRVMVLSFPVPSGQWEATCADDPDGPGCDQVDAPASCRVVPALGAAGLVGLFSSPTRDPIEAAERPFLEALQVVDRLLDNPDLQVVEHIVTVLGGDPGCAWDAGAAGDLVAAWAERGIGTHVLVFDEAASASPGAPAMERLDPALLDALKGAGASILSLSAAAGPDLVSELGWLLATELGLSMDPCALNLVPPPPMPERVFLLTHDRNGQEGAVPRAKGWTLDPTTGRVDLDEAICGVVQQQGIAQFRFAQLCQGSEPPTIQLP